MKAFPNSPPMVVGEGSLEAVARCQASESKEEEKGCLPTGKDSEGLQDPNLKKVASVDLFQPDGKFTAYPTIPNSLLLHKSDGVLSDDEASLSESSCPTGYFPCYRTCVELPPPQSPDSKAPRRRDAETYPGGACNAGIQGGSSFQEGANRGIERGKVLNTNLKGSQVVFANGDHTVGQPRGGPRPVSLQHVENHLEKKEGKERPPKPPRRARSPSRPNVNLGDAKDVLEPGTQSSLLPAPLSGKSSPQKKPPKGVQMEDMGHGQGKELKQVRSDQCSLLKSPRKKPGPQRTGRNSMERSGGNSEGLAAAEKGKETHPLPPPLQSCTAAPLTSSPEESHPSPSRHRTCFFLPWRHIISRKSAPPTQKQPATRAGVESGHQLHGWVARHRGHVYPHPC